MESEDSEDLRLVRLWRSGDRRSGDLLLRRYTPVLQRFFWRRAARNVDELVQRTLVACVQALDRFEGRSSFKSYLLGIAHNQFLMSLRVNGTGNPQEGPISTPPEETPSQLVALKQEQSILVGALSRIGPEYINVVVMYYWNGASVEEIAQKLGVKPGTVKSRLSRGRALLKERILSMSMPPQTRRDLLTKFVD